MRIEVNGQQFEFPDGTSMQDMEQAIKPHMAATWWDTIKSIPETTKGSVKKAVGGTLRGIGEQSELYRLYRAVTEKSIKPILDNSGSDAVLAGKELFKEGEKDQEAASPGKMGFWQRAVQSGLGSTIEQIPTIAATLATKNPAPMLVGGGLAVGGRTYGEVGEKRPDIGPERRLLHAGVDAAAEAIFSLMPTRFLLDAAGGPVMKLMMGTLLREIPSEIATTAVQSANAKFSTRPEMTAKEYGQDILDTIGATIVGAPAMGGVAKGISSLEQKGPTHQGPSGELLPGADTPATVPGANVAAGGVPAATDVGDNTALSPTTPPADLMGPPAPKFDQPTRPPVTENERLTVQALIDSLDADSITEEDVAKSKANIAKVEADRKAPVSVEAMTSWGQLPDVAASDVGATAKQANNAAGYVNPNDATPRMQRKFTIATNDQEAVGKTPEQTPAKPGTYFLGQESEDRPQGMINASVDSIEAWRKKWLPNSTIILGNETLQGTSLGSHSLVAPGVHYIVPGVFRKPKDVKKFSMNAQAGIWYTLTHEFGHALIEDRFFEGLPAEVVGQIRKEARSGILSESSIAALPPAQQAVAREYNAIKARIINGTMTAQEFVDSWLGPAKAGRKYLKELGVAPDDNAGAVLKALRAKTREVADRLGQDGKAQSRALGEFFNFDEYLAEQTARAAYKGRWEDTSQLGQYFKDALQSLRDFFIDRKKEQFIKPGVSFQEWLDGLSKFDRAASAPQMAIASKEKIGKSAGKEQEGKPAAPKKAPIRKKLDTVEHNVATSTDEEKTKYSRTLITSLIRSGVVEPNSADFKELSQLARDKDWDSFVDKFQQLAGKSVKFELDSGDAEETIKKPQFKSGADLKNLLELVGHKMYEGNLGNTIIKETLQNSVDATIYEMKQNPELQPRIEFTTHEREHAIEVVDNGKGMTAEDVASKFLVLAAPGKEAGSAGGFAMAKAVFLFGPASVELETTHNGVTTYLTATKDELLNQEDLTKNAKIEKTGRPNGTRLKMWLPKGYKDEHGVERKISLPWELSDKPMIAPVHITFNKTVVPTGRNFPIRKYWKPIEIKFSWGTANLYIHNEKTEYPDGFVLSHGVPQFTLNQSWEAREAKRDLKHKWLLDIKPTVSARHTLYPFNLSREGFKPAIGGTDIEALLKYLEIIAVKEKAMAAKDAFARVKPMQRVKPSESIDIEKSRRKFKQKPFEETEDLSSLFEGTNVGISSGDLTVDNEVVYKVKEKEKYKGSFEAPKVDFEDAGMALGEDPNTPILHNNTNFDPVAFGEANGLTDVEEVLAKLGTIVLEFRDVAANVDFHSEERENIMQGFAGISLDKGYAGVNLSSPYTAMFINPLYGGFNIENSNELIGLLKYVLVHEAAHYKARNHGDSFVSTEAQLFAELEDMPSMRQIENSLREVVERHYNTLEVLRNGFRQSGTENLADSLGETLGGPAVRARNLREAERTGRGPRSGKPIQKSLSRFELERIAATSGISEETAKQPGVLAEAAGLWKKFGFDSKYFKAWFGDWRTGEGSKVLTGHGAPLVLFHASNAQSNQDPTGFDAFDANRQRSFGFHFGTLRGAHARAYEIATPGGAPTDADINDVLWKDQYPKAQGWIEGEPKKTFFLPVVLNIRNPVFLGEVSPDFWFDAALAVRTLQAQGIATQEDVDAVTAQWDPSTLGQVPITPLIQPILERAGYDGLSYPDLIDGDTSWVALYPEQVKSMLGTKTFSHGPNMNFELDFDTSTEAGSGASKLFRGVKDWLSEPGALKRALRRVQHLQFHVLQIQQLAHLNPGKAGLQMFVDLNTQYNSFKSKLQAGAERVINEWSGPTLGKENNSKIGRALRTEQENGELWFDLSKQIVEGRPTYRYVMSARAEAELLKLGIDIHTPDGEQLGAIILGAKNALLTQLNAWEDALITVVRNRYSDSGPEVMRDAIIPIKRMVQDIRKKPFFPQGRFGNFMLTVEQQREGERGWTMVHREAFESRAEWEKAFKEASARTKAGERIRHFELKDQEYTLLALPLDFMDLAASELGLSDEKGPNGEPSQVERLTALLQPARPDRFLRTYDLERLKLRGYSKDEMRNFAAFTWHNANLIAKTKFRSEFNQAIRHEQSTLRSLEFSQAPMALGEAEHQHRIVRAMQRARDYIMAPANEMQALRTFVSVAYLALNVKAAVSNLAGLMTTWSDLTSRLGQAQGNKVFFNGLQKALRTIKITDLNAARKTPGLTPEDQTAMDKALEEGVLSQSYAYHLAGVANSGTLWRMPAGNAFDRVTHGGVDAAMWMFRLTELSTRRATFLSQLEADRIKPSAELSDSYTAAVNRTNKLQNDYSAGNRVPFMRGSEGTFGAVMPVATIFMSFAQHMAFHGYGGYELGERRAAVGKGESPSSAFMGYTMKIWLVTLLLAGYEGLPGAENLIDLIEALWRKVGGAKPIRQQLREVVQSLEVEWLTPGLAARGLGHNMAGYDVSRSLGFGRLVPGTDSLAHPRKSVNEQLGILALDMMGPAGGFINFGLGLAFSDKPVAERFEKLPGGIGNIYTAYRWSEKGVTGPTGAQITHDLKTGEIRDLTAEEIFAKGLGFNPAVVSHNREIRFAQYDRKIYWEGRRQKLLRDVWTARVQKDREAEADARKAILEFNASIPAEHRALRVTGAGIAQSMQARERAKRADEQGKPLQRTFRSTYEEIEDSF